MNPGGLTEHFFRHEYGRLVATLVRRVGLQHHETVEDAVQTALLAALDHWRSGPPDNPSGWLYRVAHNELLGNLSQGSDRNRLLEARFQAVSAAPRTEPSIVLPGELADDLLRMLFACCHESIPVASQLVIALKILCGLSVPEIALRLFTTEANVYKRIARARERLRSEDIHLDLGPATLRDRVGSVHQVLYLLFTEGYLSSNADAAVRADLCDESIRLTSLLALHPVGDDPATAALLALMLLHRARLEAREDAWGNLVLLKDQDRSLWDVEFMREGFVWLARSAEGSVYSRYHAEAAVAAEHCRAPNLASTRWDRVAESYALLERLAPSPLHRLNRSVAVAEMEGPEAGLALLDGAVPPAWLPGSWMWAAVLADLHLRAGHTEQGSRHRREALDSAPTAAIRQALARRLCPS